MTVYFFFHYLSEKIDSAFHVNGLHGMSLFSLKNKKSNQNVVCYNCLFVLIEVLRPSQRNEVMLVYLTTLLLGRLSPLSG